MSQPESESKLLSDLYREHGVGWEKLLRKLGLPTNVGIIKSMTLGEAKALCAKRLTNASPSPAANGMCTPSATADTIQPAAAGNEIAEAHRGSGPGGHSWDKDQLRAIRAVPQQRQFVTAGPGNGKTAVACERIAFLINECSVESVNILLVSFTRTAVAELRDRIASSIGSPARAAGVRIASIDSATWNLLSGFDSQGETAFGGYEANIERLCDQLRHRNEDLLEHLSKYEHIVVDEAQDILGARAELIELIIGHVAPACGITVLADPCQAIYGFTSENGDLTVADSYGLVDRLQRDWATLGFEMIELKTLHRTSEPSLIRLLNVMRPTISTAMGDARDKYRRLRTQIEQTAPKLLKDRTTLAATTAGNDGLLILYRTRAEALLTASLFCSGGIPHRLRISGLPAWLQPWIGAVFADYSQPQIEWVVFERRWNERRCEDVRGTPTADQAWQNCLRVAGYGGRVKLDLLRRILARSRPPTEFCVVDSGTRGPTIGTIHASKGREANSVFLYLPQEPEIDKVPWDEEARVLYVGATRARNAIQVATGGATYSACLEGGRPTRLLRKDNAAQFEVGRDGDLDVTSIVSPRLHTTPEAISLQENLRAAPAGFVNLVAESDGAWDWRYRLRRSEGGADHALGEMTKDFSEEMFAVARRLGCNSPRKIPNIWQVGVRTVVLPVDSPQAATLIAPFDRTGIFLVPVLRAWTKSYFRRRTDNGSR